jgi:hypothetical protein
MRVTRRSQQATPSARRTGALLIPSIAGLLVLGYVVVPLAAVAAALAGAAAVAAAILAPPYLLWRSITRASTGEPRRPRPAARRATPA